MKTTIDVFLPGLAPRRRPKPLKPKTPAIDALDAWRAAWADRYGRTLSPPTAAAWKELHGTAATVARLCPDGAVRDAFFRWYLALRDDYVAVREHPLRLALVPGRLERGLAVARRAIAERRRVEQATASARAQAQAPRPAPVAATCAPWTLRLLGAHGVEIARKTIHAADVDAARRVGTAWLFAVGTAAVTVEVSDGRG